MTAMYKNRLMAARDEMHEPGDVGSGIVTNEQHETRTLLVQ